MNKLIFAFLTGVFLIYACGESSHPEKSGKTASQSRPEIQVPVFDEDSAYAYVQRQVAFGPRVPNTEAHDKAAAYLLAFFRQYADTAFTQDFDVRAYNGTVLHAKNIIAAINPAAKRRILLSAHWDSRPYADHDPNPDNFNTPIDAANDGASGVAVLMEMVRDMAKHKPGVGVDIVLFDVEDYGDPSNNTKDSYGLGSQYWAQNPHIPYYQAEFGVLLDMVGAKDASFPMEYFSLNYASDIVKRIWNTAERIGYGSYFPIEPGGAIEDDHVYVNRYSGLPMVDIIHLDPNSSNGSFFEYWHTTGDTMDKIDKNTLKAVGETLLRVIYED